MNSTKIAAFDLCSRLSERAKTDDFLSLRSAVEPIWDWVSLELHELGEHDAAEHLRFGKDLALDAFDRAAESAGKANIIQFGSYSLQGSFPPRGNTFR